MASVATSGQPEGRMTRAEYRLWVEARPGRFERSDGQVVAMAPERIRHTRIKGEVYAALRNAVAAARLPCEVLPDGPTIEVGESDYEPHAIIRCGADPLSGESLSVPDPVVIVEVLSPTTRRIDVSQKLADYFRLPTVQHYLILFADRVQAIHHRRGSGRIETRVLTEGEIALDPPGVSVLLADLYPRGGAMPAQS